MVNRRKARIFLHDVIQLLERQLDEIVDLQLVIGENIRPREHEAGREVLRIEFHGAFQNGLRLHVLPFLMEKIAEIVLKSRLIRRERGRFPQVLFSAIQPLKRGQNQAVQMDGSGLPSILPHCLLSWS